jgi:hypothetical protein
MDDPSLLKTDHFSPRYLVWHNAQRLQRLRAELGGLLRLYNVAFRPPRLSFWAALLGAQARTPSSSGKAVKGRRCIPSWAAREVP